MKNWNPPNKNCGLCGVSSCEEFIKLRNKNQKQNPDCIFFTEKKKDNSVFKVNLQKFDILGNEVDFILDCFPGENSCKNIILPFRPDAVDILEIEKGDIICGRPMGAGCPITHVMKVINVDRISGVIDSIVVGPAYSRDKKIKDIKAYHQIGFEGIARPITRSPGFGRRMRFIPGFCMMNLAHTGVVNMVLEKEIGTLVRVEDIIIGV